MVLGEKLSAVLLVSDTTRLMRQLTLLRAGEGGHIVPPVNFLKYLKNAFSYRVETF